MVQSPSIEVRHLRKVYGEVVAVDDLTFTVPPGAVLGLLGGNGAGKTTTISMLLGLLEPTAGEIQVLGIDMRRHRYAALPRMNFSSPYVDLPHRLTVRQNLLFYGRLYGVKKLRHPRFGPVEYSHVVLEVADNPDHVLVSYAPAEGIALWRHQGQLDRAGLVVDAARAGRTAGLLVAARSRSGPVSCQAWMGG